MCLIRVSNVYCTQLAKHISSHAICSYSLFLCSASKAKRTVWTNNQEENVDEADSVQSDGKFLYAAYDDVLLAWDIKNGKVVVNITMPTIEYISSNIVNGMTGEATTGNDDAINGTTNQNVSSDDMMNMNSESYSDDYKQKVKIQWLLLTDNRLTVVIGGYGESNFQNANSNVKPKIMSNYLATRLQFYDTSALTTSGGKLKLLYETDINGNFYDSRVVGSSVHLVTVASFDIKTALIDPLSKQNPAFVDLSTDNYVLAAIKLAEENLIPTFVDQLVEEIFVNGTIDLARLNLLQSKFMNNTAYMDHYLQESGILKYMLQVVSFDLSDTLSNNFTLSMAGAFLPSSWCYFYSTEEMLIVAIQGFTLKPWPMDSSQTTYLLGFKLDGASSTPYAVGSIDGDIMGQHSVDIHEGYIRLAATTISDRLLNVSTSDDSLQHEILDTKNYITILEIPTVVNNTLGELKVVGETEFFGKERIFFESVRFFDDIAYCVTYGQTSSFYVVNLTDPVNPKSVGVLNNITGMSSFLYPINSANTVMLSVARDQSGVSLMSTRLQLTVFDASDPSNPVTLQQYTLKTDEEGYSLSDAQWEFKTFRYLSLGNDSGVIIMPLTTFGSWNESLNYDDGFDSFHEGPVDFEGFVVFDVNKSGITERTRISHENSTIINGCFYKPRLPARSFVSAGDIITMKGQSVISTNLDTGNQNWNLTLPVPEVPNKCLYM